MINHTNTDTKHTQIANLANLQLQSLNISQLIASELSILAKQAQDTIDLLQDGNTIPFIARYRKEHTGYLTDTQLRALETLFEYYTTLEARKLTVANSLNEQNKWHGELKQAIEACTNKQTLEDLYAPHKPKRKTKAMQAKEYGLEPLAMQIWQDNLKDNALQVLASTFITEQVKTVDEALSGARDILAELWAQDVPLLNKLREQLSKEAQLSSQLIEGALDEQEKFKDYYECEEALAKVASHRMLAMLRGQEAGILQLKLHVAGDDNNPHPYELTIAELCKVDRSNAWLANCVRWTWKIKLALSLEVDCMQQAKAQADLEAINVFAKNLKDLLLAAPAGTKTVLGLDPGFRTGIKCCIINPQGDVLHTSTLMHLSDRERIKTIDTLEKWCNQYSIDLIAIGNGTASRETSALVSVALAKLPHITKIIVNEAGASIYSASEFASQELPDLDVSIRGAVSIARRLQDPLAELVKIPPQSIGVGQYQHDVDQKSLSNCLDKVVEDCVNQVGVDVNTASSALLARISGLNMGIAKQIVVYRQQHGAFNNREQLKNVPRLGDKTFEQAAGFLRIKQGSHCLDATSIHPESYNLIKDFADLMQLSVQQLLTKVIVENLDYNRLSKNYAQAMNALQTKYNASSRFLKDVFDELCKPKLDPRPEFVTAKLSGVDTIEALQAGMLLEGTVTNVSNFGAFVDIGVHQDGLIHVSEIADQFVDDIHAFVKAGDIIKVRVLEVDVARKRISLSKRTALAAKQVTLEAHTKAVNKNQTSTTQTQTLNKNHTHTHTHSKNKTSAPQSNNPFEKLKELNLKNFK